MNRNELLQFIYDLGLVQGYCRKLANSSDWPMIDDLVQEIFLQLCEVPEDKWADLQKQGTKKDNMKAVRGYVSGLIYRNIKSKNSRYYNKMKKHLERELLTETGFISEEQGGTTEDA